MRTSEGIFREGPLLIRSGGLLAGCSPGESAELTAACEGAEAFSVAAACGEKALAAVLSPQPISLDSSAPSGSVICTSTRVPRPTSECSQMCPPIRSTSCLHIDMPSPTEPPSEPYGLSQP